MRETVQAVKKLTPNPDDTVTLGALAAHLKLDKGAVSRRVKRALRSGWLVNDESRSRQPAKLRTGEPLPDEKPALPTPENMFIIPQDNSATAQQRAENPHGDAAKTVVSTVARSRDMQQSVQQHLLSAETENEGADALLHCCAEDSNTVFPKESKRSICRICGLPLQTFESQAAGLCSPCRTGGAA